VQESLSQDAGGSASQISLGEPSASTLKRKRDEWFEITDSEPIAPAPASKVPKTDATTSFSASQEIRRNVWHENGLNVIVWLLTLRASVHSLLYGQAFNPHLSSLFPDMPMGFWWEVARLFPGAASGSEDGYPSSLEALRFGRKSNEIVATAVANIARSEISVKLDDTDRKALSWEKAAKVRSQIILTGSDLAIQHHLLLLLLQIPWTELDKEDHLESHAIHAGSTKNVYLWEDGASEWYGGKVHFSIRLVLPKEASTGGKRPQLWANLTYVLDEAKLASSTQFSRQFGSKRFLRLRVPDTLLYNNAGLVEFCKRPFIFFSWVFRAFYAKGSTVFLVKTNEVLENLPDGSLGIRPPSTHTRNNLDFSFHEFFQWHNPLELNVNQVCRIF
jgi:hypothetical protein